MRGTEAFWEKYYWQRTYSHPIVRTFALQRINFLRKHIGFSKIQSALDVGCGSGFSTYYLTQYISSVLGVDISTFMLSRNPLPRGRLVQADARKLPFRDESFDLVYCWELLHHFSDPWPVVQEMVRVSRRWVVIFKPCRYHPVQFVLALLEREHRPILKFSRKFMIALAEKAGLKIHCLTRTGWLFPNKTPWIFYQILKRLPFENQLGISYALIASKEKEQ